MDAPLKNRTVSQKSVDKAGAMQTVFQIKYERQPASLIMNIQPLQIMKIQSLDSKKQIC